MTAPAMTGHEGADLSNAAVSADQRVCVIMTCYNEGPYIEAAVRSVLDQTRADIIDRIVIMDDGSEPATVEVLKRIEAWDPRIDIDYGSGGVGQALNRNRASQRCKAPLLAILDGDDLWAPAKLERQLALMAASPDVGLTYTGYHLFHESDPSTARAAHVKDLSGASDLTLAYFLNDPPILPSTVLMRREAFERVGGMDPTLRVFEETDLYLRMSRATRFAAIDEPLIYKRNRTASITGKRPALMAHHAFVAFKFAAEEPRLLPLVPKRLAERARKLGNVEYYQGSTATAATFYRLAIALDARNLAARAGLLLAGLGGSLGRALMQRRLRSRSRAYGTAG